MKKIRLKENKKIERFKCDNSKMMQLATNSKNYHKKKLEEKLLIQLNNLNNTLNKNKVLELIEIAGDSRKYLVRNFMSGISKGIDTLNELSGKVKPETIGMIAGAVGLIGKILGGSNKNK